MMAHIPPKKPQGQITRGKTAHNRLRRIDLCLMKYDAGLLARKDGDFASALVVDLGYGRTPVTTVEMARRLHTINPQLPILGIEIDPQRVAAAESVQEKLIRFRLGGFNMPLETDEKVRLIRAMNVLRQYNEDEVEQAYAQMAVGVLEGGLLFEGTSDPHGRVWVINILRRSCEGWDKEALICGTNFRDEFDPERFQTVLPKNLIHRVVPGERIYDFFNDWHQAVKTVAKPGIGKPRTRFRVSIEALHDKGWPVITDPKWLSRGMVILKHTDT